jgi:hypothetical protein
MIRQTDLIERVKSWTAPDWSDPISLETAWIEWAQFATIKRCGRRNQFSGVEYVLIFSFIHQQGFAPRLLP